MNPAHRSTLIGSTLLLLCLTPGIGFGAKSACRGERAQAHAFGTAIQAAIERRDLELLYSLVAAAPDFVGPRPSIVRDKRFDEVFSEPWRERVLDSPPPCDPVGWRGYMLGNGQVWFDRSGDTWAILAINEALDETPLHPDSDAWTVDGKRLSPACFSYPWLSGDNYQHFNDTFAPEVARRTFLRHIGRFIGREVPLEPVASPWPAIDPGPLGLTANLAACSASPPDEESQFQALRSVSGDCARFAPNVPGHCVEAKLVTISPACGGTLCSSTTAIYGVFATHGEHWVVPLMNFRSENEGLDLLDALGP